MYTKAPKSTKKYYSNNRQNKNLLFDRLCWLFDFVDYDYLSNNRQKIELYTCGLVEIGWFWFCRFRFWGFNHNHVLLILNWMLYSFLSPTNCTVQFFFVKRTQFGKLLEYVCYQSIIVTRVCVQPVYVCSLSYISTCLILFFNALPFWKWQWQ